MKSRFKYHLIIIMVDLYLSPAELESKWFLIVLKYAQFFGQCQWKDWDYSWHLEKQTQHEWINLSMELWFVCSWLCWINAIAHEMKENQYSMNQSINQPWMEEGSTNRPTKMHIPVEFIKIIYNSALLERMNQNEIIDSRVLSTVDTDILSLRP